MKNEICKERGSAVQKEMFSQDTGGCREMLFLRKKATKGNKHEDVNSTFSLLSRW